MRELVFFLRRNRRGRRVDVCMYHAAPITDRHSATTVPTPPKVYGETASKKSSCSMTQKVIIINNQV